LLPDGIFEADTMPTMRHFNSRTAVSAASVAMLGLTLQAEPWPQYRGAHGDGVGSGTISTAWPANGPKRLWTVPTTAGFSSFAVSEGKAFTLVERSIDGTPSEVCLTLDAASGKELWATPIGLAKYPGGGDSGARDNQGGDGPRSTPSVDSGRVYVYSADMVLTCLDATSGKLLWKKDIITEFNGKNIGWKSAMSPAVDGDLVYVAGGGAGQAMLAFDKVGGVDVWKAGDDAFTHASPLVATVHGVRQVIYMMQSGLVAVDAAKGTELWRQAFPHRTSTACLPVLAGDIVFCTAGYEIGSAAYQIVKRGNQFTTRELWRVKGNKHVASLWSPPVYKDGFLYGMMSFKQFGRGPLKCVDIKTGEVKWEQAGFGTGNVVLVGNHLVALSDDGYVSLVEASPAGFKESARFKAIPGKCWSTPALADGRLYVRSTKEGACFDLTAN